MDEKQKNLLSHFSQIRARYRGTLKEKISRIEELSTQITIDPKALSELSLMVHTLAGSAATFGFSKLGGLASEIEALLSRPSLDVEVLAKLIRELTTAQDSIDQDDVVINKNFRMT